MNIMLNEKDKYFALARKYLNQVELDINEKELMLNSSLVNDSIKILKKHSLVPTPCIEIKLKIYNKESHIANYFLYLSTKNNLLDDFFYFL